MTDSIINISTESITVSCTTNEPTIAFTIPSQTIINGGAWGAIDGDIENQEDLIAELDLKEDVANKVLVLDNSDTSYPSTSAIALELASYPLSDSLADVAFSGDYEDLSNKPGFSGSHTQLSDIGVNTHTQIDLHIGNTSNPHGVTKAQIGLGNVADVDTTTTTNISDSSNKRFVTDAQLVVIGNTSGVNTGDQDLSSYAIASSLASVATSGNYADLSNKPTIPSSHTQLSDIGVNTHTQIDTALTRLANTSGINTGDQDLSTKQDTLVSGTNIKTLGNTSLLGSGDIALPVVITSHTALSNIGTNSHSVIDSHLASTTNPHAVTKSQVGLTNVSDVAIPFLFGSGNDGNVTISTTVTLTRTMHYNNLTINAGGELRNGAFLIFVKNTLDLTNAPANAITAQIGHGGDGASDGTAGVQPVALTANELGIGVRGGSGGIGATGIGSTGSTSGISGTSMGFGGTEGSSGASGVGGSGSIGSGGNSRAALSNQGRSKQTLTLDHLTGATLIAGAPGGGGGGSGAGNISGTLTGAGGGAGGNGGGIVAVYAKNITRASATTASGAISANGGNGGNGGSKTSGNTGGGGGGGSGGGGHIYLVYQSLAGSTVTGLIAANGGSGGNGGNGVGTGTGGAGASGAYGGCATIIDVTSGTITLYTGSAGNSGNAASGVTGGSGGSGGTLSINL